MAAPRSLLRVTSPASPPRAQPRPRRGFSLGIKVIFMTLIVCFMGYPSIKQSYFMEFSKVHFISSMHKKPKKEGQKSIHRTDCIYRIVLNFNAVVIFFAGSACFLEKGEEDKC